jgi:hypothetical protein
MNIPAIPEEAIIPVITGLVQWIKMLVPPLADNPKWCSVVSAFFGMSFGLLVGIFFSSEPDMPSKILRGTCYGLAACGLYSVGNTFKK